MGKWRKRLISLLIVSLLFTGAYGALRALSTDRRLADIKERPWYEEFRSLVEENEISPSEISLASRDQSRKTKMSTAFLLISFCHGMYLSLFLGVHSLVKKMFKPQIEGAQQQNPELSPAAVAPDEA
jgi:hypothetical protein